MKKQSNLYIFIYSSVMVIVVAALLALASTALKPFQQKNIETEKKLNILESVDRGKEVGSATNKHAYVEKEFNTVIVKQLVVNRSGNEVQGLNPFEINLKEEFGKPQNEQNLPIFVAKLSDGSTKYIFPLLGGGLWGPVWGYIAVNDDYNTIFGTSFDHASETPGLGAEISQSEFQEQFKGKQIFKGDQFVSISVVKQGAKAEQLHSVDAISGGTITSQGVEDMIEACLKGYEQFLRKSKKQSHEPTE